jgi:hypothetical protein
MSHKTEQLVFPVYITQDENQDGNDVHFSDRYDLTIGESVLDMADALPHYRDIIRNGGNATTALSGTLMRVLSQVDADLHFGIQLKAGSPTFGYRDVKVKGPVVQPDFSMSPPLVGSDLMIQAENQARTQFYSHLASEQSAFKGAVFTGELRETLHAIRHPALALRRGVGEYLGYVKRHGRLQPLRKRRSWVRKTWLEYSLGWSPLISDIDSAIQQFYRSKWIRPIFVMVRGRGRAESLISSTAVEKNLGYGFHISWNNVHKHRADIKYYGLIKSTGQGIPDGHSYGFSPWEFVPTVWELIPYSFLVDYFTNIGNIISSWSYRFIGCDWAARGTSKANVSSTEAVRFYYFADYYNEADYTHWMSGDPGSFEVSRADVVREPSVSVPLPTFQLSVPGLTSLKWLNIAALTTQLSSARRALEAPRRIPVPVSPRHIPWAR